jgi:glycosyltransferase involved in cell wall biosynthesis
MTSSEPRRGSLAVVILTYNEEANVPYALSTVVGWADEVLVLDSKSTDRTIDIAKRFDCHVAQHSFEDYAAQRNFALEHLPITAEWVLFLDADERVPAPLREEISQLIAASPDENGFYLKFRLIWMNQWIRRGYYPSWILRLFRHGKGRCGDRAINERVLVQGATGYLSNDLVHEDRRGVSAWIAKHNVYASREALELARPPAANNHRDADATLFGGQVARKHWIRRHVWNWMPPLIRPFVYFFYRYVLRLGFLDGIPGFTFHFLQALWYPMLIDIMYLERRAQQRTKVAAPQVTHDIDVAPLQERVGHERGR